MPQAVAGHTFYWVLVWVLALSITLLNVGAIINTMLTQDSAQRWMSWLSSTQPVPFETVETPGLLRLALPIKPPVPPFSASLFLSTPVLPQASALSRDSSDPLKEWFLACV